MKKVLFIILMLAASFGNLQAMGPSNTFKLIALEDGTIFNVPRTIAVQSGTIQGWIDANKIEGFSTNTLTDNIAISASTVSKPTLLLVAAAMNAIEENKGFKNRALLDAVAQELDAHILSMNANRLQSYINLLKAADFLDFKPLYQLVAREIINIVKSDTPLLTKVMQIFSSLPDVQKELARWKYLLTGTPAPAEIQKTFNVSLRELLDYGTLNRKVDVDNPNHLLNLSNLQLTDLDGLQEIPNIKICNNLILANNKLTELPVGTFAGLVQLKYLNLDDNQLSTLPVDIFTGLVQLKNLHLDYNQLSTLPVGVFAGLTQLSDLFLDNNQLSTLPVGTFAGLARLGRLYLWDNQLSTLPVGVFAGLAQLKDLYLNSNQLSTLPVGTFAGLARLGRLHLGHNQLSTLPVGVFAGLIQLEKLYLDNNQLSTLPVGIFAGLAQLETLTLYANQLSILPVGIFAGLAQLRTLDLKINQLSEENKEAIRAALPRNIVEF